MFFYVILEGPGPLKCKTMVHKLSSTTAQNTDGVHTVKKVNDFPVPSRDVTDQTLLGQK